MERSVRKSYLKTWLLVLLSLSVFGCASITVPSYIRDKNPYEKIFYAPFDTVRETVAKTFEESGWTIEKELEPALFERERGLESGKKQTLIFTGIRQISFFLGSRFGRVNAYIHEVADNETEVEIRYLTVTSIMFKEFYGYKNDRAVKNIFVKIEENLKL